MRTIKFRMWHDDTRCMYADSGITSLGVNDAIKKAGETGYIIMQFTGIHDKNGKDIYEGDIISDKYDKIGMVGFYIPFAGFVSIIDYLYKTNFIQLDQERNQFEIIGNIYENPELLKQHR